MEEADEMVEYSNMAVAYITDYIRKFEGDRIGYMIRVLPSDLKEPFLGPSDRRWAGIQRAEEGNDAGGIYRFSFRSRIDEIRDTASNVDTTEAAAAAMVADPELGEYIDGVVSALRECEDEEIAGVGDDAAAACVFARIAAGEIDPAETDGGSFSYYPDDSDAPLQEAAKALDLPPWAHVKIAGEGGPGTGFDAPYIVLQKERDVHDLARWLTKAEDARCRVGVITPQELGGVAKEFKLRVLWTSGRTYRFVEGSNGRRMYWPGTARARDGGISYIDLYGFHILHPAVALFSKRQADDRRRANVQGEINGNAATALSAVREAMATLDLPSSPFPDEALVEQSRYSSEIRRPWRNSESNALSDIR
jgi:hypothetical protein